MKKEFTSQDLIELIFGNINNNFQSLLLIKTEYTKTIAFINNI